MMVKATTRKITSHEIRHHISLLEVNECQSSIGSTWNKPRSTIIMSSCEAQDRVRCACGGGDDTVLVDSHTTMLVWIRFESLLGIHI